MLGGEDITGTEVELIPEGEYEDIYEGNYLEFLESFNSKEKETGLYRVMDICYLSEKDIRAIKLDFIF